MGNLASGQRNEGDEAESVAECARVYVSSLLFFLFPSSNTKTNNPFPTLAFAL